MIVEVLVEERVIEDKPPVVNYTLFFIIENKYYQIVLHCGNYLLKIGKTRKEIFKKLLINGKLECPGGIVYHLNLDRSNFIKKHITTPNMFNTCKDWWYRSIVSLFELEREDIKEFIDSIPKIKHNQSIEFQDLIEKLKITISHQ